MAKPRKEIRKQSSATEEEVPGESDFTVVRKKRRRRPKGAAEVPATSGTEDIAKLRRAAIAARRRYQHAGRRANAASQDAEFGAYN